MPHIESQKLKESPLRVGSLIMQKVKNGHEQISGADGTSPRKFPYPARKLDGQSKPRIQHTHAVGSRR